MTLRRIVDEKDPKAESLFNHCDKDANLSPDEHNIWFSMKSVKQYQFSRIKGDISRNAGCSRLYTAHCLRATAIQGMNDSGLSEVCSHVAALLFKIEATGRLGYTRKACTEEPCNVYWPSKLLCTESRFFDDLNYPFIGVSADGIATCDCHGSSVVEVKCPFKYISSLLPEFLADPNTCLTNNHELKKTHQYFSQSQLQMCVHNIKTYFFVVRGEKFTDVSNVTNDNAFIKTMREKYHNSFINAIVHELQVYNYTDCDM
ncbi:unnamed protein product [Mytilus coruscus]|uniref:YqaJ viral recombinase domain-containing protein n=1 Tax=Mytilus coruscus TaxID=42192 RepID=A0A6J8A8X7_MYTCO|nr:unnamed protein product [Mytilus coruscus]